jgi:hypothetical protein
MVKYLSMVFSFGIYYGVFEVMPNAEAERCG